MIFHIITEYVFVILGNSLTSASILFSYISLTFQISTECPTKESLNPCSCQIFYERPYLTCKIEYNLTQILKKISQNLSDEYKYFNLLYILLKFINKSFELRVNEFKLFRLLGYNNLLKINEINSNELELKVFN